MADDPKGYVARIAAAAPAELVAINYEMIIGNINEAVTIGEAGADNEVFALALTRAKELLDELILSLNHEYEISSELLPIYLYVNKLILEASSLRTVRTLGEAERILSHLLGAWRKIAEDAKEAGSGQEPVFKDAGKIYSGLTYDRFGRAVEVDTEDGGRDFKA
jgi:flagellar protein FliS